MKIEWNRSKAKTNLRKHGIDFADAASVLVDDLAVTIGDPLSDEERFVSIGRDASARVLVVVCAWRDDTVRLISARKATRRERRQYEERT